MNFVRPTKRPIRYCSLWLAMLLVLGGCGATPPQPPAPKPETEAAADHQAAFDAAVAMMREGRNSEARVALETLLVKSGDSAGIHLNLALLHRQTEEYADALEHVNKALAQAPDNPSAHNLQGSLLRQQGDFLGAAEAYERALAQDPDYSAAHLNLGILCDIYLKEWPRARRHYQRYLALEETPDPRVAFWLQDLEMRISESQP